MKLKVMRYNKLQLFHECMDETTGLVHRVDLTVDGSHNLDQYVKAPESLIGKYVEVEHLFPFIEVASGVSLCTWKTQTA